LPPPIGPRRSCTSQTYADLLVVDGNPLNDVSILGDDGKNIPLIIKDGKMYRNTL